MKNFLIEFFIKLGATLFYAMLALLILGGGSIVSMDTKLEVS